MQPRKFSNQLTNEIVCGEETELVHQHETLTSVYFSIALMSAFFLMSKKLGPEFGEK